MPKLKRYFFRQGKQKQIDKIKKIKEEKFQSKRRRTHGLRATWKD
jgi:hypothetical protein